MTGLSVARPNPNSLPDIGPLGIGITSLGGDRLTFISAGACAHGILRLTTTKKTKDVINANLLILYLIRSWTLSVKN